MATYSVGDVVYSDGLTYTITSDCTTATGGTTWYNQWYSEYDQGTTAGIQTYTLGGNGYYQPILWRPGVDGFWQSWGAGGSDNVIQAPVPVLTPEQIAETQRALEARRLAAEEEQRVYREQEAARRAVIATREVKAQGLIKEILGELQYTAFQKHGYVDIPSGCDPNKRYRIRPYKMIGIVRKMGNGEWQEQSQSLCIHPKDNFVDGDVVATKIALCKFDEAVMLRTANLHQMRAA